MVTKMRTWRALPEHLRILTALAKAGVEKNESDRVRAGLVLLAKSEGVKVNV